MERKCRPAIVLAGVVATWALSLVAVAPARSGESARPEIAADAAFERLKALAGTWRGKDENGQPVTVEFKAGARGTTVLETQNPGARDEMISVYSRDGGEVVMTHYCPMGPVGNQPHMRLDRAQSTADELVFAFTGGTNLDAGRDTHVHAARITRLGPDSIKREWDVYQEGRKTGVIVFLLARVP